jgi:hypothetical protein
MRGRCIELLVGPAGSGGFCIFHGARCSITVLPSPEGTPQSLFTPGLELLVGLGLSARAQPAWWPERFPGPRGPGSCRRFVRAPHDEPHLRMLPVGRVGLLTRVAHHMMKFSVHWQVAGLC